MTESFTTDAIIKREWLSDEPFYLHVVSADGREQIIDIAEYGWHQTYAEWMRGRLRWYLVRKVDEFPVLVLDVRDGEQPFYYRHSVERLQGRGAGSKLISYCLGAKRLDGTEERMYVLPNGIICSGSDVDSLSEAIIDANAG